MAAGRETIGRETKNNGNREEESLLERLDKHKTMQ